MSVRVSKLSVVLMWTAAALAVMSSAAAAKPD